MEKNNGLWIQLDSVPTFIHPSKELTEFIKVCRVSEGKELIQVKQKIDGDKYLVDYMDSQEIIIRKDVTESIEVMRENIAKFNNFRTKHIYKLNGEEFTPKPIYRSYRTFNIDGGYIDAATQPLLLGGRFQGGITQLIIVSNNS